MNQLITAVKTQLEPLFNTQLAKLAAIGSTTFGVTQGNHWLAVFSGAAYAVVHFIDSTFNSPQGTPPST